MQESFLKFKKRILLESLLKSIIIGLFPSLIIFSTLLLYSKISKSDYNILYIILISLGVFIIIFGITFIITKPTNIKVAKRLDKQLNLNEKVQTMVEYSNNDSLMINLQRESTLSILNNTPIKKLAMKISMVLLIILSLSCIVCVTAIVYPVETEEKPPVIIDPDYTADSWTIAAIKDLIKYVEKSSINETLKQNYVYKLTELLNKLDTIEKESQMKEAVNEVIDYVYNQLEIINTNEKIYEVLKSSKINAISALAITIKNLNVDDIDNALDQFAATINGDENAISIINEDFGVALRLSDLDQNDGLYIKLFALSENLNKCISSSDLFTDVYNTVNSSKEEIKNEVGYQKDNSDMAEYIETRLKDIFGLNENNDGDENDDKNNNTDIDPTNPDGDKKNDETKVNSGGLGKGDILVGSDDIFFDPEVGSVKYAEVITSYYGTILGKINDGTLPSEYKEYFDKYFELLFGSLEDKEGE